MIIGPLFAIVIITYYSERSAFAPVIFMKLETKNFYKTVGALVLPIALQNLINVAVTSADVVMLGRVGETVLSGSSLAGQVQFVLTLFLFGLTSGAAVLTAQYWGKKDMRTIEKVMGIAFRFSIIVSVIFLLAVQIFPAQVMSIFTPEQPVIDEGVKYLRIVSFSYLTCAVTHVYLNVMRSVERVVIATVTYSVSLIVNIIINGILIFGLLGFPQMGIVGAAIGTLVARIVELLIVVVYARTKSILNFKLRDLFVRDKLLFQDFIRYAIPVTLNELMWGTGCSVIAVVIGEAMLQFEEGEWVNLAVGAGFLEIVNNRVTMLVQTAEKPEDIDARLAQEQMEYAEEKLRQKQSIQEYYRTQASLSRAMNRLKVSKRKKW